MISVIYHRSFYHLTIEGHAGSGEHGHDLVCASASALAYTLAENLSHLESLGHLYTLSIRLDPGHAELQCRPVSRFKSVVKLIFDSICAGFAMLAREYPQNISYQIRE